MGFISFSNHSEIFVKGTKSYKSFRFVHQTNKYGGSPPKVSRSIKHSQRYRVVQTGHLLWDTLYHVILGLLTCDEKP